MIFELYTPETIMGTESSRNIIHWYMRFDLFAGLMSGSDLKLGREWFVAYDDYWRAMVKSEPENLDYLLDSLISDNILLGTDMALLFAKLPRGAISMTDFATENAQLQARIQAFGNRMQPLIQRQDCLIMPFAGTPPLGVADVVNPFQPGGLYSEPLWALNYVLMDRCAIDAMHRLQTSMVTRQDLSAELIPLAMEQCRIFEAIEMWPGQLTGSLLPAQATCGLVALLLPREGKYTMWCRRKLAKIESMGYVCPLTCFIYAMIKADMLTLKGTSILWPFDPSCLHSGLCPRFYIGGFLKTKRLDILHSCVLFAPSSRIVLLHRALRLAKMYAI